MSTDVGQFGDGRFAAHDIVVGEVKRMYRVSVVGHDDSLRERVYAISVEKRIKDPAVLAVRTGAQASSQTVVWAATDGYELEERLSLGQPILNLNRTIRLIECHRNRPIPFLHRTNLRRNPVLAECELQPDSQG